MAGWLNMVLLLVLFYFCLSTNATHVDEVTTLPNAAIQSPDMLDFTQVPFQLNCTGTGTLRWYRNSLATPLDDMVMELNDSNTLILNVSAVTSESTFFCTANNSLGTARSRSIEAPFFEGFLNGTDINTTIIARLGEAVAIKCNVDPSSTSVPSIVWYKNDQLITPNPEANTPKYNSLNDGLYLVIYDLVAADITVNNELVQYKCGVRGVVNPQNSTLEFTLLRVTNISGKFIVYRPPMNMAVRPTDNPVYFYYIGATNATTQAGTEADSVASFNPTTKDIRLLLRVPFQNTGVSRSGLAIRLFDDQAPIDTSSVTVGFTVVAPLNILQVPTNDTNTPFHRFEREDINFTCSASGTNVRLSWYFNGAPLTVTGDTLVLTNITLNEAGVYQCLWNGFFPDDTGATSWALTVQRPVQPRGFIFTTQPTPAPSDTSNRTLVPIESSITLNLTFGADSLPTVSWTLYDNLDTNNGTTIDTVNNTDYTMDGPRLLYGHDDMYWVSLTIINVTQSSSGFYGAAIDDNRTPVISTSRWFISSYIPTDVISFTVGPNNCLLSSESSFLTCIVRALPNPTITFRHDNNDVPSNMVTTHTDPFTGITNSTLIIGNSMNDGTYNCRANSMSGTSDNKNLETVFCRSPTIRAATMVTATAGDTVQLNCTVNSAPTPRGLELNWYNMTTPISGPRYDMRFDSVGSSNNEGTYRLIISAVTTNDMGVYRCEYNNTVIPEVTSANITLVVNPSTTPATSLPWQYIGIGIGGGVVVAIIVLVLLIMCCYICVKSKKSGNYNTRSDKLASDFTDGRGNVDQDSDEEDGGGGREEPEAFQPQYESLPALRPTQPPQYKPSPAYNQGYGDDLEMVKMPIPDTDFDYPSGGGQPSSVGGGGGGGYFPRHDNGGIPPGSLQAIPHGSHMTGLHQPRYDDFMSDDGQFV